MTPHRFLTRGGAALMTLLSILSGCGGTEESPSSTGGTSQGESQFSCPDPKDLTETLPVGAWTLSEDRTIGSESPEFYFGQDWSVLQRPFLSCKYSAESDQAGNKEFMELLIARYEPVSGAGTQTGMERLEYVATSFAECTQGTSCSKGPAPDFHNFAQGDKSWVFGKYETDSSGQLRDPLRVEYEGGAAKGNVLCVLGDVQQITFRTPDEDFDAVDDTVLSRLRSFVERACDLR